MHQAVIQVVIHPGFRNTVSQDNTTWYFLLKGGTHLFKEVLELFFEVHFFREMVTTVRTVLDDENAAFFSDLAISCIC